MRVCMFLVYAGLYVLSIFRIRLIDMHKRSILKYIGNYVKSDNYVKSKISENIKSDSK